MSGEFAEKARKQRQTERVYEGKIMNSGHTAKSLIEFEDEMAAAFADGKIRAPLHLAGGNEQQLLELFEHDVRESDYILGTWRSHYHCLLKGVPRDELKEAILDGRSIALSFPKQRVLCSAIVAGIAPIAVGLAWAIAQRDGAEVVHCFLGDMAWRCGITYEARIYANAYRLPVKWYVEDNKIGGTQVPTQDTWGGEPPTFPTSQKYEYHLTRPFVGIGAYIPL